DSLPPALAGIGSHLLGQWCDQPPPRFGDFPAPDAFSTGIKYRPHSSALRARPTAIGTKARTIGIPIAASRAAAIRPGPPADCAGWGFPGSCLANDPGLFLP